MKYRIPQFNFNSLPTTPLNKFGRAPSGVQTTASDIWSGCNSTPTQQIWLAPTAARIHAIVSSSVEDKAGGTGATSLIVTGLKTWTSAESSETVTLDGTTPVNTANSYVIIHRMKCVASATTTNVGVNVGTITATAAVNNTVTARVEIGQGQTQMAIYGVPSGYDMWITAVWANLNDAVAATRIDLQIRVNENPSTQTLAYINKFDLQLGNSGTSSAAHHYDPPYKISGPAIVKMQGISSSADTDVSAGWDALIVRNS